MKQICLAVILAFATIAPGTAEEVNHPANFRINQLNFSTFVPPAPKEPKEMPDIAVKASVEAGMENGKRVRIVRAEPSHLPDLESILLARSKASLPSRRASLEFYDSSLANHRTLALGATVIDGKTSHVTWTDRDGILRSALCGFDISLLEGVPYFRRGDTEYFLFLVPGRHVTERDGRFVTQGFSSIRVKPGEIVLPEGKKPTDTDEMLSDLATIRDLIVTEKESLEAFQAALAARRLAERKWREENPEPPRDESIWFRPHSGSRYLKSAESPSPGGESLEETKE